jgi:hypothetical protein
MSPFVPPEPPLNPDSTPSPALETPNPPPEVGFGAPWAPADGENRDQILNWWRAWFHRVFFTWIKTWTEYWAAQWTRVIDYSNEWFTYAEQYIEDHAVNGHSWWKTDTPILESENTTVTIPFDPYRPPLVGDLVSDSTTAIRYGQVVEVIDATTVVVTPLGTLQGVPGPNTVPTDTAIAGFLGGPSLTRTALDSATDEIAAEKVGDIGSNLRQILDTIYAQYSYLVQNPVGFTWSDNPLTGTITADVDGGFTTTYDITTKKTTGGVTYYVNGATGSNTNDGLSVDTPLATLAAAVTKTDVVTIYMASGIYTRTQWAVSTITKSLNIIGVGNVRLYCHDVLPWTLSSGQTNTYQAARTAVGQVVDSASGGRGTRCVKVASISAVEATPGSWYHDGTNVYVHTYNGRAADALVYAFLQTPGIRFDGLVRAYLENLTIWGGNSPVELRAANTGPSGAPTAYLNNLLLGYATQADCLRVLGAQLTVSYNCEAYSAMLDGFNYHEYLGVIPKSIEIGCRGFYNGGVPYGSGGGGTDQGSTAHDGASVIRLNSEYLNNYASNIADVNPGTESWNMGCIARGSLTKYDFELTSDNPTGWFDRCDTSSSSSLESLVISEQSVAYVKRSKLLRVIGTPIPY